MRGPALDVNLCLVTGRLIEVHERVFSEAGNSIIELVLALPRHGRHDAAPWKVLGSIRDRALGQMALALAPDTLVMVSGHLSGFLLSGRIHVELTIDTLAVVSPAPAIAPRCPHCGRVRTVPTALVPD